MTLYLKYRPQKIEELDLESVRLTIKKIVSAPNLPHAFLFCGSKGTGKTSAARILAKVINCQKRDSETFEPCNKCETCKSITKGSCVDVIELDAASNRGIDDIRTLRDSVSLSPAQLTKKVYIIDEVHMLTTEAANAFLKTLEEPPAHVIFILATTNPEKLPSTILSRLTTVTFSKASSSEIARQLKRVMKGEKLEAEDGVIDLITKASDGSFRDAVKTLEQLAVNLDKLSLESVNNFLFQANIFQIDSIISFLAERKEKKSLEEITRVLNQGGSVKHYLETLLEVLHGALLAKSDLSGFSDLKEFKKSELLTLVRELLNARNEMQYSYLPQLPLELAIINWCNLGEKKEQSLPKIEAIDAPLPQTEKPKLEKGSQEGLTDEVWKAVLTSMKDRNSSIEALLRAAKPVKYDGEELTLGVYYKFHKERLEVGQNRKTLEEVIESVFGVPVRVSCLLTEKPQEFTKRKDEPVLTEPQENDIIKAAKEIFGT